MRQKAVYLLCLEFELNHKGPLRMPRGDPTALLGIQDASVRLFWTNYLLQQDKATQTNRAKS